jgi:hypothetical protein
VNDEEFNERRAPVQRSAIEQHIGTILQILVVGLLAWSLSATVQTGQDVGILKVKVESLQATLAQGSSDRYRGTDAARDFKTVDTELSRMDRRLQALESKTGK